MDYRAIVTNLLTYIQFYRMNEGIQGQAGQGPGKPHLVGGIFAYGRGVGTR